MHGIDPHLTLTDHGLYCPAGDFYIDPWRPVKTAVITHAHADHARPGHQHYITALPGLGVLTERIQPDASCQAIPYRQPVKLGEVWVTLYPAGHILGSAQVLIEHGNHRLVISGDYKRHVDPTCEPFEPVPCDTFITEATFALPIYRWPDMTTVITELNAWWRDNAAVGRPSIVFCYALGKAQRILMGLSSEDPTLKDVYCHTAIERLNTHYRDAGVCLPQTLPLAEADKDTLKQALILAPPACQHNGWLKRFPNAATAFASGWMLSRAGRKQRQVDRGFIISDHTDWPGLLQTIQDTGASNVWVTHGRSDVLVHYLQNQGINAQPLNGIHERTEEIG